MQITNEIDLNLVKYSLTPLHFILTPTSPPPPHPHTSKIAQYAQVNSVL